MNPLMIGISGSSCSGKTTLARLIAERMKNKGSVFLSLDSYYRDLSFLEMKERKKKNFDIPEALDRKLLKEQINDLYMGKEIMKPIYSCATHTREERSIKLKAKEMISIEGLFTFYWKEIRDMFDIKIFITLDYKTGFSRRLERDIKERKNNELYVKKQFKKDVWPMYERYVLPTKKYADIHLNGKEPIEKSADAVVDCIKRHRRK